MENRRSINRAFLLIFVALAIFFHSSGDVNAGDAIEQISAATQTTPSQQGNTASATTLTVTNQVALYGAKRLGINIGKYDQYGAAQFLKNLIPNPGFEAGEFGMIFLAAPGANATRVQPHRWITPWNGHPAGYWDNAFYEIISGVAKGRTGRIRRFNIEGGKYTFYLTGGGGAPNVDDAILVRREVPGYYADQMTSFLTPDISQQRPGSPGVQSLRMSPSGYKPGFAVGFDSFARDRIPAAGKLRIVEGNWGFSIWAKAQQPGQTLEIKFHRVQEREFFVETVPLQPYWQKIERRFYVPPGADGLIPYDTHPLAFELRIASGTGDVWLDDVELGSRDHHNRTAFSDNYVNLLRELQPGVIRYWGEQLGSSLESQIAEPFARQTMGHDPYVADPLEYQYSLHEFLELAWAVGAEPWYVIPPTFTAQELRELVAYLSAPAGNHYLARKRAEMGQAAPWTSVFHTIHLEFGNELWGDNSHGDPFRGSSLRGGERLGEVTNFRFSIMRGSPHFNPNRLNLIAGGQAGFPGRQQQIENASSNHDTIAVAPYFGVFNTFNNDANMYQPLFASPTQNVNPGGKMRQSADILHAAGNGTELAIYEINYHLKPDPIPLNIRNDYYTGMGGISLPLHMLTYQRDLGIRNQAAFTSAQYATQIPARAWELTNLWGLLRDVEATGRKRPTWLGMEIVNRVIKGNIVRVEQSGASPFWLQRPANSVTQPTETEKIQAFAFNQWKEYGMVLFNLDLWETHPVRVQLPGYAAGNITVHQLSANSIHDDNENAENIKITTRQIPGGNSVWLELPPHSIIALEWKQ